MKHGSLFSGIGGFDLAAEWMGWKNIFHCEWNEFGQKILKHYWPDAISYGDITKTDFTVHRGAIDVLTGGFPCQPYSSAGKRLGKEDDRHLWPEMLRAIREIQPRWIVGENVRGLINWNGGMVFREIKTQMEAEGYQVTRILLPACGVGAPHRRDRIWFVAYSGCEYSAVSIQQRGQKQASNANAYRSGESWVTPHPRLQRSPEYEKQAAGIIECGGWNSFPTQSPLCSRNDGLSSRLARITFSKHKNESIKAYGNSVVPQLVFQIFKSIDQYER